MVEEEVVVEVIIIMRTSVMQKTNVTITTRIGKGGREKEEIKAAVARESVHTKGKNIDGKTKVDRVREIEYI